VANLQLLNNVDHADVALVPGYGAAFGDSVNQCLVFPTEFEFLQSEYVILIQKNDSGAFQAVALLGLDKDENLFLDSGEWNTRYVPAMHRRGPFMIGFQDREVSGEVHREPMIHIDIDHPRIAKSAGMPLFLPHGGNTAPLEQAIGALQMIHEGMQVAEPMFTNFGALGLIQPAEIEMQLSETERYQFTDYYTICRDRLAALDGDALEHLHKAGFLELAFHLLGSLRNAPSLITSKNCKLSVANT
jgi:hypothetical protein